MLGPVYEQPIRLFRWYRRPTLETKMPNGEVVYWQALSCPKGEPDPVEGQKRGILSG